MTRPFFGFTPTMEAGDTKKRVVETWLFAVFFLIMLCPPSVHSDSMDNYKIGRHGQANIKYPAWFKESFLDLREDLEDARKSGKRGIIVFFSQKNCNHCLAFISTTLSDPATKLRVLKHYDIVALDIFSDLELTDIDGSVTTVKDFAETQRARLTPTFLFYGTENTRLLKIIGFYPPEKFNQVLDYIDGGHFKRFSLRQYLHSRPKSAGSKSGKLKYNYSLFSKPPHILERSDRKAKRPLLVFFDRRNCKACTRFHTRVLASKEVQRLMPKFHSIQLDASDTGSEVVLPDGRKLTPGKWADELQLAYDFSVVFFDTNGKEVHRLDSETGKDRMAGSMQYVLEKAYRKHQQFLRWRRENAMKEKAK